MMRSIVHREFDNIRALYKSWARRRKIPFKEKKKPIYSIEGRIVDFESVAGMDEMDSNLISGNVDGFKVGLRHKVRMCKASKHQSQNGLHAWQEATIDDLVPPNYAWHVCNLNGPPLHNDLKRYYGKAVAVVELCVTQVFFILDQYNNMMRLDVVHLERDEVDLVA
ncbi:hypothetical protein REPUB_Repub07fG0016900 [Reevesia pubescens]